MSWLVPRESLTLDQVRAVELDNNAHQLVLGSPGSGKTMVALHRARELVDRRGGINPPRFRIFVYTNALKSYIQAGVADLGLPRDCVVTFDKWCIEHHHAHIGGKLPGDDEGPDFLAIRAEVLEHVRESNSKSLDFAMVDEGQDLNSTAYEILTAVSKHLTVFMDSKQQLYENGSYLDDVRRALGIDRDNFNLLAAYRCTPYIVRMAASFICDEGERERFIAQNQQNEVEGARQQPLVYIAGDNDSLLHHLVEMLRSRLDRGESIGVLFPSNSLLLEIGATLLGEGIEVEFPRSAERRNRARWPSHDFASIRPKLMAYPSAKGLTFDSVLLPFFNRRRFRETFSDALLERWVFVAMTRATRWIYINGQGELLFEDRLRALEAQDQLAILREGETPPDTTPKPPSTGPNDLSDLF